MAGKMKTGDQGSIYRQWLVAILANTTILTYGLQYGWVAASAKTLQSDNSPTGLALSDSEISWLASSMSFSATISVALFTFLVDRYGRKKCVILISMFQAIGWIITMCPSNTTSLLIARISCGIAGGGCFNVIPMYVKEISEDNIRGVLGLIMNMAQNSGILVIFVMGGYLPYDLVLWIVVGLPFLTIVGMMRAPQSPSFLVKIGKYDEAAAVIAYLRGHSPEDEHVQNEIMALKSEDMRFKELPKVSYVQIFKHKAWGRGLILMNIVMICRGLNGGFSIINYATIILTQCKVTINPELQSLAFPTCMIIGSLFSMVCVERLGRKIIILTSFFMSGVIFSGLSALLLAQSLGVSLPGWLPTLVIVLAVCAFAIGVSPMPFVIMAEMFNFQIRAKVMGVAVTMAWLSSSVQILIYNPIANTFGTHIAFICFAVVNFIGAFVILIFLPETRGKSVEEIECELERRENKNSKSETDTT